MENVWRGCGEWVERLSRVAVYSLIKIKRSRTTGKTKEFTLLTVEV
jgi:hypothetical protein